MIQAVDVETGEEFYFGPAVDPTDPWAEPATVNPSGSLEDGLQFLSEADLVVAHFGLSYDSRMLTKLYPQRPLPKKEWDSLVVAKMVWPYDSLIGPDLQLMKAGKLPGNLLKTHGLKAWGIRLGENKIDFTDGKDKATCFLKWTPEMAQYGMQDIRTGLKLWKRCLKRLGWTLRCEPDPSTKEYVWPKLPVEIEHAVFLIIQEQTEGGVNFDMDQAVALAASLKNAQAAAAAEIKGLFGSWWQPLDPPEGKPIKTTMQRKMVECSHEVTLPRFGKKGQPLKPYIGPPLEERDEGSLYCRVEWTDCNPGSRDHLSNRLAKVYGWTPVDFGKDGKPKLDETVLEEIPDHVVPRHTRQLILDYFKITKTLGMLEVGKKGWIGLVREDGRIHPTMDTLGALTSRATHKDPNISCVPRVDTYGKAHAKAGQIKRGLDGGFGYECRELFIADPGWEQTGVDATALEFGVLGHYLAPLDDMAFATRASDPSIDLHEAHAVITGLSRQETKTCGYLYIYGGTAWKLSFSIEVEDHEVPALLGYKGLSGLMRALEKRFGEEYVKRYDDKAKALLVKARKIILAFEAGITGIKDLKEGVTETAKVRGWVKGLDGRKLLTMRKPHAALNTLLQGGGSIACKLWMVNIHEGLAAAGLRKGIDWRQILWSHDEFQFTHRPGLGPTIIKVAEEAIIKTSQMLGLRGQLRSAGKTGLNWAECH